MTRLSYANVAHTVEYVYLVLHLSLQIKTFIFVVNAADNKQRDKNMTCIKVSIDP